MADVVSADEVIKQPGESLLYAFIFRWTDSSGDAYGMLGTAETISSVSGVTTQSKTPADAAAVTIGSPAANAAAIEVDGRSVAIGQAVQVRISGGDDAADYRLQCTVVTSAGNTRILDGVLKVRD